MSSQISFMKKAVRNRIRNDVLTQINGTGNSVTGACELTDYGRPTVSYQGLVFYSINSGRRRANANQPVNYYLDEYYDFRVTISIKTAHIPRYRIGDVSIDDTDTGIQALADLAIVSLNGYLALAEDANDLILDAYGETHDTATHALFITGEKATFQGAGDPVPRPGWWFGANVKESLSNYKEEVPMGLSMELSFTGLRLIREIGQK